jgi:hypothetical protein
VKGNKQGGVWFGTFEFTPLLGVGVNNRQVGGKKKMSVSVMNETIDRFSQRR